MRLYYEDTRKPKHIDNYILYECIASKNSCGVSWSIMYDIALLDDYKSAVRVEGIYLPFEHYRFQWTLQCITRSYLLRKLAKDLVLSNAPHMLYGFSQTT